VSTKSKKITAKAARSQPAHPIDGTERKQAEKGLQASETRYRRLFETAKDGILILNAETGVVIDVNPFLIKMLGFPQEEICGKELWELGFFKDIAESKAHFKELQRKKYIRIDDLPLETADGRRFRVEFVSNVYQEDFHKVIQCNIRDITEHKQAEDMLEESESMYRSLIATAGAGVATIDIEGKFVIVNQAICEMFGYSKEELISKPFALFLHPDDTGKMLEIFQSATEQPRGSPHLEFRGVHKDGHIVHCFSNPTIIWRKDRIIGFNTIIFDITERKRAEELFLDSEKRYRELFENINSGVAVYEVIGDGQDFIFKDFNRAGEKIDHAQREKLIGKSIFEVRPGVEQFGLIEVLRHVWQTGEPAHHPVTFYQDNQLNGWYENFIYKLPSGEIVTVFENITERKRVEEDLKESEAKYRSLIEQAWDGIFVVDSTGRMLLVNQQACQMLGYSQEELLQLNISDTYPVEQRAHAIERIARTQKGEHLRYERMILRKDGTFYPVDVTIGMLPSGLIQGIVRDITERKEAEAQIAYQANLLAQVGDAIVASDEQYRLTAWNLAAEAMYGWKAEEVLGHDGIGICRTEWVNADPGEMRQMIAKTGHWHGEATQARKDGTRIPVEVSSLMLRDDSGQITGYVSVNRDITERKQAEEVLRETNDYLENLFNYANAPIIVWDPQFKITRFNHAFETLTGRNAAEVLGKPLEILFPPAQIKASMTLILKTLSGEHWEVVEINIQHVDDSIRTVLWNSATLFSAGSTSPIATIAQGQDITERKRAEVELSQSHEQLRALTLYWQTAFEEERAHIARELHDEFGQSMTALKMDLAWLTKRLPEEDEKVDRIRGMTKLVDESVALMRRIATDLRPGLLDDLGLNAALEWQAQEFSRHSGIPCKVNLPKDDLALDPALNTTLFRIFQETLTNIARHAQATRVNASLKQNEQTLVLTIRDNGRGITEAELTNPHSLGLLSLHERAAQWGGKTNLRGTSGKGTTVTVRIPLPRSQVYGGR
jgi:PAS domain S-box-containing protein